MDSDYNELLNLNYKMRIQYGPTWPITGPSWLLRFIRIEVLLEVTWVYYRQLRTCNMGHVRATAIPPYISIA
jgi:hypothetical protein